MPAIPSCARQALRRWRQPVRWPCGRDKGGVHAGSCAGLNDAPVLVTVVMQEHTRALVASLRDDARVLEAIGVADLTDGAVRLATLCALSLFGAFGRIEIEFDLGTVRVVTEQLPGACAGLPPQVVLQAGCVEARFH